MPVLAWVRRNAGWKWVLVLGVVSGFLATFIITMLFGQLSLDSDATLDPLHYYNAATFYEYLDLQGSEGRSNYLLLHGFDYLFIPSYVLFLSFSIALLVKRAGLDGGYHYLALLPFVSGISDFFENLLIDVSIVIYPSRFVILAHLAGVFTAIKMFSLYITFLLLLVLAFVALVCWLRRRRF